MKKIFFATIAVLMFASCTKEGFEYTSCNVPVKSHENCDIVTDGDQMIDDGRSDFPTRRKWYVHVSLRSQSTDEIIYQQALDSVKLVRSSGGWTIDVYEGAVQRCVILANEQQYEVVFQNDTTHVMRSPSKLKTDMFGLNPLTQYEGASAFYYVDNRIIYYVGTFKYIDNENNWYDFHVEYGAIPN